jgi:hypothetical protein
MTRSVDDLRAAYREPPDPAALARLRTFVEELAQRGEPVARRRRNRTRWLAPGLAAVVVIAVFASIAVLGRSFRHTGGTASGRTALRLWADFPVNASPRPLVLTAPDILDPVHGFPNGDDKMAYISGDFELTAALPTGPSSVDGQRVITAAEALAQLRSQGDGQPVPTSLRITAVTFGTASFATDRGIRSLPAWTFRFAGVTDPAMVLAIPSTDRWPLPGMPMGNGGEGGVRISPDGRHLTLSFIGGPPGTGPCESEYTADTAQSPTAVLISPRELPHRGTKQSPQPGNDQIAVTCALVGVTRTVTVTLQSPLGNRVIIDSRGVPLPAS